MKIADQYNSTVCVVPGLVQYYYVSQYKLLSGDAGEKIGINPSKLVNYYTILAQVS